MHKVNFPFLEIKCTSVPLRKGSKVKHFQIFMYRFNSDWMLKKGTFKTHTHKFFPRTHFDNCY